MRPNRSFDADAQRRRPLRGSSPLFVGQVRRQASYLHHIFTQKATYAI